jgi:FkbM family methyltransferase
MVLYVRFYISTFFLKKHESDYLLSKKNVSRLLDIYKLKIGNRTASVLFGNPVSITDSFWYLHSLKEIFVEETYKFKTDVTAPYILDCGSNIGLSVIYFKRLFPKAEIVAFEPDKHIYDLLNSNLKGFGFNDITVENKAIWREKTILNFSASGSLGGKLNDNGIDNSDLTDVAATGVIKVETVRLRDYLTRKIDFLKIDIEGPEIEVLLDCDGLLENVQNLFVEYHSDPKKTQDLDILLSLLKKAGFRIYIKEAWNNLPLPFMRKDYNPFYDLQLNIFAYRM